MTEELNLRRKKFRFKFAKTLVRILYSKPKFVYLGEKFNEEPFIFLVNHVGSSVPTRIEQFFPNPFYMWGTYEMTGSLKDVQKYLIHIYYHQKKKVPLFFAAIIGTLFAPFAKMFYSGMHLIATYPDERSMNTLIQSLRVMKDNNAIVIYPEDSSHGYKDEIDRVFNGFLYLAEALKRKGTDIPIYVSYYLKKKKTFIIDQPILFSDLEKKYASNKDEIAESIRKRMNELSEYKKP